MTLITKFYFEKNNRISKIKIKGIRKKVLSCH